MKIEENERKHIHETSAVEAQHAKSDHVLQKPMKEPHTNKQSFTG